MRARELRDLSDDELVKRLAAHKLPIKTKFVIRAEQEAAKAAAAAAEAAAAPAPAAAGAEGV